MTKNTKKFINWIIGIFLLIPCIYLVFFAVSIIPSTIFSPVIVYEIVKDPSSWSDISLYYKLVIIFGAIIFLGIIVIEIIKLIKFIKDKIK
ncbi:hypothetical protein FP830_03490 [Candidatus Falkowbacteria bacterium]|nr:hypothetical protein [Candidatus Falkowbacteria bacterium]MBU4014751.1 hypothetical protein [Patescibacteria group bacterium]